MCRVFSCLIICLILSSGMVGLYSYFWVYWVLSLWMMLCILVVLMFFMIIFRGSVWLRLMIECIIVSVWGLLDRLVVRFWLIFSVEVGSRLR